jgi:hypothetical protein
MSSSMLVHDTRVSGTAPAIAPNTYLVNGSVPLNEALGWIATYAKMHGGLTQLSIMCHGYAGGVHDSRARVSTTDLGFGLEFCRDGLALENVHRTVRLKGLVELIILYACGPARTRPGFEGTSADGRAFCRELAAWTGAEVLAGGRNAVLHEGTALEIHQAIVPTRSERHDQFRRLGGTALSLQPRWDGHADLWSVVIRMIRLAMWTAALIVSMAANAGCRSCASHNRPGRATPICAVQDCTSGRVVDDGCADDGRCLSCVNPCSSSTPPVSRP